MQNLPSVKVEVGKLAMALDERAPFIEDPKLKQRAPDAGGGRVCGYTTVCTSYKWVSSVAYSPDGRHIASASDDRTILIWDAEAGAAALSHGPSLLLLPLECRNQVSVLSIHHKLASCSSPL